MTPQADAILKLLQDDDSDTLQLVKAQLAKDGPAALPQLQELLNQARPPARAHLSDVIASIETEYADALFTQLCTGFGEVGDLEEAAWRLAATFSPGDDFRQARRQLDLWGAEVARRLPKALADRERSETLTEFLGIELGFQGNSDDYYNVNNSLLPEVVETRRGLPITLSLVYMFVGRRAGLDVQGVGLPGHFIIRRGEDFFDPFNRGRRLTLEDCRHLLAERQIVLTPSHLMPVSPRQTLTRMLANLQALCTESDPPMAAKIAGWMEALYPPRQR